MRSIADIVKALDGCPCGLYDPTPEQIDAMYYFEHRLIASLHRLYIHVPQETADKIVGEMLKRVAEQLE